jgi:hypothetical protein
MENKHKVLISPNIKSNLDINKLKKIRKDNLKKSDTITLKTRALASDFFETRLSSIIDEEELNLKDTDTIQIRNMKFDKTSFIILISAMVIFTIIWAAAGLFGETKKTKGLFVIYIIAMKIFVYQIIYSSTFTGNITYEQSNLVSLEQLGSMFVGSIVVLTVFISNIKPYKLHPKTFTILMLCIMLGSLMYVVISFRKTGYNLRIVRKVKQAIFNIVISLFIAIIYLNIAINYK